MGVFFRACTSIFFLFLAKKKNNIYINYNYYCVYMRMREDGKQNIVG